MLLRTEVMLRQALALVLVSAGLVFACGAPDEGAASDEGALIDTGTTPMSKAQLDAILARHPELKTLDALPAQLPPEFRLNFLLKHGRLYQGEHGHLTEEVVSQSSDPGAPRAILWDERSGFSVSYNGGKQGQTEPNRLDVLEWDEQAKAFHLSGLQFDGTGAPAYETDATIQEASRKCTRCHGPNDRPIFSMYPDWPSFYGSDNDELTDTAKAVQSREFGEYKSFRRSAPAQPRYSPLFDAENVRSHLRGTQLYDSFPYRADTNTNIEAVSRAFAFRPSLRFGITQNRIMSEWAAKRVIDHPNYDKFGALFLHDLLECRWSSASALSSWKSQVSAEIGHEARTVAGGKTLHYRDLLALFDLKVNDIDLRYSYNHAGYDNDDASNKVMEVGYIDGAYWNSYFDGSATIDELLSKKLYDDLASKMGDLRGLVPTPDGLVTKYQRRAERFKFDKNFFQEMDKKGNWIPIPYPRAKLDEVHHREGYPASFQNQHDALCGKLESHLASSSGGSTTATSCPAGCVASNFCRDNPNASSAIRVDGLPCVKQGVGGCQPCR